MQVRVTSHREPEPLDLGAFERLALFVLSREDVPEQAELSVALVGEDEMTHLNEQYRGLAEPTDVLSFACDDPCLAPGDEPIALGDVIIVPTVAEANAVRAGETVEAELNLLLVHGILHILGYDHSDAESASAMETRENTLLEAYKDLG